MKNNNQTPQNKNGRNNVIKRKPKSPLSSVLMIILTIAIIGSLFYFLFFGNIQKFNYGQLNAKLGDATITWEEVTFEVDDNLTKITGSYKQDDKVYNFESYIPSWQQKTIWDEFDSKVPKSLNTKQLSNVTFTSVLISLIPWIFMIGIAWYLISKMSSKNGPGGAMTFGKSRHKQTPSKVTFKDVAGAVEEKQELEEIVDYLKSPEKFAEMGARTPKGVLLSGAPGTGKTLLAKAVAGEAKVPFFSISGSDFVEMFVGVGASRVRDMFKEAKKAAPCIIFIDEIDAVGRSRGTGMGGGNDEREQTLNQLLVEMDGFEANSGVIIIAATNRPDVLDPALLRPGRFDRSIMVASPDVKERIEILKVHTRNKKLDKDLDLDYIASITPGFSGADLENVINEAALLAVRGDKKVITFTEVDEAIDRVMAGPAKKSKVISADQKKQIAYHEAGHAIVGVKVDTNKVQKVTIIPRGRALGYVLHSPEEDKYIVTKKDIVNNIIVGLAGRAAEEIIFGKDNVSSGAQNDIENATKAARSMVTQYGMTDLGMIQFEENSGPLFLGKNIQRSSHISEETTSKIDQEVKKIIDNAYVQALKLLKPAKKEMDALVESLLSLETLAAHQIEQVIKTKKPILREKEKLTKVVDGIENVDAKATTKKAPAKKPAAKKTPTKKAAPKKEAKLEETDSE